MRVVSFCLWGSLPKYTVGALRNAELCPRVYPGFVARFAVGSSVPREIVDGLRARGAEVLERPEPGDWRSMFWRFEAAADPRVEVTLSRDCDSRLNDRERAAVDAWLASGRGFHVMRDHPWHTAPILGGMFGVRAPLLRDLPRLLESAPPGDHWQVDQEFLARAVWPLVERDALVHDEFFGGEPFPTARRDSEFVGQVFDEAERSPADHRAALEASLARPRHAPAPPPPPTPPPPLTLTHTHTHTPPPTPTPTPPPTPPPPPPPHPLRLLLLQERGRHDRNRDFREALCLARGLASCGVLAHVTGLGHPDWGTPLDELAAGCDAVLTLENYDTGWHPDLAKLPQPKLFWSIDSHVVLGPHVAFARRHRIDLLLNSSEQYLAAFDGAAGEGVWFPNAYPDDRIGPTGVVQEYDLGFCGSWMAPREKWLDELSARFSVRRDHFVLGPDMVRAIGAYRIGLNLSVSDDLNYRVFETLGCGTFLATNEVPGLDRLLEAGRELVTWRTAQELEELCDYYLAHEAERQTIARAGLAAVRSRHTYARRAAVLRDLVAALLAGKPAASVGHQRAFRRARTTVLCSVWHGDPNRHALLAGHRANLDAQTVPVERLYVFDAGDAPPPGLDGQAIVLDRAVPLYTAWNAAIARASTPFLLNLNLDDRLCTDGIERLEAALDGGGDLACGDFRVTYSQAETDAVGPGYDAERLPHVDGWPPARGRQMRLGSSGERGTLGPSCLWRRSLHGELGPYPDRFADGGEVRVVGDWIWWQLLQRAGKRIVQLRRIVGHYHSHPGEQLEFRGGRTGSEMARAEATLAARMAGARCAAI